MTGNNLNRNCDDVDELVLNFAEIKALCAGNPIIVEKMALDSDVAKLRMLKSEYKGQHYRLEDSLIKRFSQQITAVTERIAGIEKDIAAYAAEKALNMGTPQTPGTQVTITNGAASVSSKFPGMMINGVTHTEKESAAKALLEACKGIKGRETELPVGEFMGFKLSLSYASFGQTINLMMRGAMTYQVELGTDAFGNIQRITNALDKLPERLDVQKRQLENLQKQAAAKEELAKPFTMEEELQAKEARLALLNADLNIDGDMEVLNDLENRDESEPEQQANDESEEMNITPAYASGGDVEQRTEYSEQHTGTYGKALP
jgi:hypothetical protein